MFELRVWHVQVAGIALLAVLASVVEKKAAMRGCNRAPLPAWFDRMLRVAFLGTVAGPATWTLDMALFGLPVLSALLALYMIPYSDLCEQRGGRKRLYARKWGFWKWLIRRLGLKLVKTTELPPDKSYIFGVHPHGILPFGSMVCLGNELDESGFQGSFPGINFRVLAATFCFYIPIYRDILLWGGVVDAARYSAQNILKSGYSLALVPGGATEALYSFDDHDVVYIKKRRGFVKLAIETGASLVPVFSFNENNTYGILGVENGLLNSFKRKFQAIFGISLPLITNLIPRKCAITVVVGQPIAVQQEDSPSRETVQAVLDRYIAALEKLYNDNRQRYNVPSDKPPLTIM